MSPIELRGRHALQAPTPAPMLWKCPACNSQQTGDPGLGCQTCGSGKPGVHVGEAPVRPAPLTAPSAIDEAFLAWFKPMRGQHDSAVEALVYEAFKSGAAYGASYVSSTQTPLAGTAESRTVIAALKLFIDQVLLGATPEELASGEFLTVTEARNLISKLERTQ